MNSEESKVPGILNRLPLLEKILLCAVAIGTILAISDIDFLVLRFSLFGLAASFFLMAYRPPEAAIVREDDEPGGFSELLALGIIPKVLWISSAISLVAIAFYFSGGKGTKEMLFIGVTSAATALVLLAFFLVSGTKYLRTIVPVLYRAVPTLIVAIYFLMK